MSALPVFYSSRLAERVSQKSMISKVKEVFVGAGLQVAYLVRFLKDFFRKLTVHLMVLSYCDFQTRAIKIA
jgi:hypothetical protein